MAIVFGPEIHIFIPKSAHGGGGVGPTGLGIIPKKNSFFTASLREKIICYLHLSQADKEEVLNISIIFSCTRSKEHGFPNSLFLAILNWSSGRCIG